MLKEPRETHLFVRLTHTEALSLRRAAASLGITVSTYVRLALRQAGRGPLTLQPPVLANDVAGLETRC